MKCLSCQSLFVHSRKQFQLLLLRQISFESVLFGTREEWQWRVQMGARGARAIPSRLKKGGEKVQSTDTRISAAHTPSVDTRTYACTYVRVAGGTVHTCSVAWAHGAHYIICVSTHCLHVDSITTRVGTCTLHHVYVYVRVHMVSASVKHALAATSSYCASLGSALLLLVLV